MIEAFQDVLRICHETPDDLTALARVSAWLRDQLRALSVAIYGAARRATPTLAETPATRPLNRGGGIGGSIGGGESVR